MKKYYLLVSIICYYSISFCQTVDQSLISSAGDSFKTDNIELTFTIGEVTTESFVTENLYLTQGFLQTFQSETSIFSSHYTEKNNLSIYPNPASNLIYAEFETNSTTINKELLIIDINGKHLNTINVTEKINQIDISELASGTYLIKANNSDETKIFQKINH